MSVSNKIFRAVRQQWHKDQTTVVALPGLILLVVAAALWNLWSLLILAVVALIALAWIATHAWPALKPITWHQLAQQITVAGELGYTTQPYPSETPTPWRGYVVSSWDRLVITVAADTTALGGSAGAFTATTAFNFIETFLSPRSIPRTEDELRGTAGVVRARTVAYAAAAKIIEARAADIALLAKDLENQALQRSSQ
jgi:hypothetical protein